MGFFLVFVIIWPHCRTLDRCVWHAAVWNSARWVFLGCFRPCTASPWRPAAPAPGARGWTGWRKGPGNSASEGNPARWAAGRDCCRPAGTSASWETNTRWDVWPHSWKWWRVGWRLIKGFSLFVLIVQLRINDVVPTTTCATLSAFLINTLYIQQMAVAALRPYWTLQEFTGMPDHSCRLSSHPAHSLHAYLYVKLWKVLSLST